MGQDASMCQASWTSTFSHQVPQHNLKRKHKQTCFYGNTMMSLSCGVTIFCVSRSSFVTMCIHSSPSITPLHPKHLSNPFLALGFIALFDGEVLKSPPDTWGVIFQRPPLVITWPVATRHCCLWPSCLRKYRWPHQGPNF